MPNIEARSPSSTTSREPKLEPGVVIKSTHLPIEKAHDILTSPPRKPREHTISALNQGIEEVRGALSLNESLDEYPSQEDMDWANSFEGQPLQKPEDNWLTAFAKSKFARITGIAALLTVPIAADLQSHTAHATSLDQGYHPGTPTPDTHIATGATLPDHRLDLSGIKLNSREGLVTSQSYMAKEFKTVGTNAIIERVTTPDGKTTTILSGKNGELHTRGSFTFAVYGAAMSEVDNNVMIVAGSTAASGVGYNTTEIRYTRDGGNSWNTVNTPGSGRIWDAQITPDGRYAWLPAANNPANNQGLMTRLDLTDGSIQNFTFSHDYGIFNIINIAPIFTDSQGNLKTYGYVAVKNGFYEINLGSSVTVNHIGMTEPVPAGYPIETYIFNGDRRVSYINNDFNGTGSNSNDRRVGRIYTHSSNPLSFTEIKTSLYPELNGNTDSVYATNFEVSIEDDKIYTGTQIVNLNNAHLSSIETINISNPTIHERIPPDGDWPKYLTDKDIIDVKSIGRINEAGKKLLVVSITKRHWVQGASDPAFDDGFTVTRDITSGINSTVWTKIEVDALPPASANRQFVPVGLRKNPGL